MKHTIFVYGSLRQGFGNHPILDGCTFVGKAKTLPKFTMLHMGGFPGIVEVGDTAIMGELYEVDDLTLGNLDHLEGHPDFYQRKPIQVEGDTLNGWVEAYILPDGWERSVTNIIQSGDWAKRG